MTRDAATASLICLIIQNFLTIITKYHTDISHLIARKFKIVKYNGAIEL